MSESVKHLKPTSINWKPPQVTDIELSELALRRIYVINFDCLWKAIQIHIDNYIYEYDLDESKHNHIISNIATHYAFVVLYKFKTIKKGYDIVLQYLGNATPMMVNCFKKLQDVLLSTSITVLIGQINDIDEVIHFVSLKSKKNSKPSSKLKSKLEKYKLKAILNDIEGLDFKKNVLS